MIGTYYGPRPVQVSLPAPPNPMDPQAQSDPVEQVVTFDFSIFKGFAALIIGLPIAGVALALAFLKIDDLPLINYVANALSYMFGTKEYRYRSDANADYSQRIKIRNG